MRRLYKGVYSISSKLIFSQLSKKGNKFATQFCKSSYLHNLSLEVIENSAQFAHKIASNNNLSSNKHINLKHQNFSPGESFQKDTINLAVRISKKNIKRAVDRNLMKRRFFHIVRTFIQSSSDLTDKICIHPGYYVFYINKKICHFDLLLEIKSHFTNYIPN